MEALEPRKALAILVDEDQGIENRVLNLPPGLPAPGAPDYTARMLDAVLPLIAAADGRAFLLFTSHRALRERCRRTDGRGGLVADPSPAVRTGAQGLTVEQIGLMLGGAHDMEVAHVDG